MEEQSASIVDTLFLRGLSDESAQRREKKSQEFLFYKEVVSCLFLYVGFICTFSSYCKLWGTFLCPVLCQNFHYSNNQ